MSERYIDQDTKRQVRRRCYFGCVVCGCPIFEYDHVIEFSNVRSHSVENLVLLCSFHHELKTRGRFPIEVIRQYQENPFNKNNEYTTGATAAFFSSNDGVITVGECKFTFPFDQDGVGNAIVIDGIPTLGFVREDGRLMINIRIYHPGVGIALKVERSELQVNTGVWDYRFEGAKLRIWSDKLSRSLSLDFRPNGIEIVKGELFGPESKIKFGGGVITVGNTTLANYQIVSGGLRIGNPDPPNTVSMGVV